MAFQPQISISSLSQSFDFSSSDVQHRLQEFCDDDPLNLDIEDDLERYSFTDGSSALQELQQIAPPSAVQIQRSEAEYAFDPLADILAPCSTYGSDLPAMPDPDTAFDQANEPFPWDPTSIEMSRSAPTFDGVDMSQNNIFYEPIKASSVPASRGWPPSHHRQLITHDDGRVNIDSHIFNRSKRMDGEVSQAFSEDVARSPRFVRHTGMPTATIASSTDPTEYDFPANTGVFDEFSNTAHIQAGVSLDLMEEDFDGLLETVHSDPQMVLEDNAISTRENTFRQDQSLNATAFMGEHLATPNYLAPKTTYHPISHGQSQLHGTKGNVLTPRNSSLSDDVNQSSRNVTMFLPTNARQESCFPLPSQEKPKFQMLSGLPRAPLPKRADSTSQYLSHRLAPVHLGIDKHRRRQSTASSTKPDTSRLSAISEGKEAVLRADEAVFEEEGCSSQPLQRTTSERTRPKRTKPLPDDKKRAAAQRRKEGNTCLPCKAHRIQCDGKMPCNKCISSRNGRACVSADWSTAVLTASCDGLFHRTLWHSMQSGGPWISLQIPRSFDTETLLRCLWSLQSSHSIHVTHMSMASYIIDPKTCFDLLSRVKKRTFDLQELFEKEQLGASPVDWLKALTGFDHGMTEAEKLITWGNMPCRAVYRVIARETGILVSPLNIYENQAFLESVMVINRIILRAIEKVAHEVLQKQCKNLLQTSSKVQEPEFTTFIRVFGKLANSLRLRIAWCDMHERSSTKSAKTVAGKADELKRVTRIIYFWYLTAMKKRQKDLGLSSRVEQNHLIVGGTFVPDPLPDVDSDESDENFEAWLSHGHEVLSNAGLAEQPLYSHPTVSWLSHDNQVSSSLSQAPFPSQAALSNPSFSFY